MSGLCGWHLPASLPFLSFKTAPSFLTVSSPKRISSPPVPDLAFIFPGFSGGTMSRPARGKPVPPFSLVPLFSCFSTVWHLGEGDLFGSAFRLKPKNSHLQRRATILVFSSLRKVRGGHGSGRGLWFCGSLRVSLRKRERTSNGGWRR